jgi:hypothetical protein
MWKFQMLSKCARMRQEWDDKYQPGRHADNIAENLKGAEKYRRRMNELVSKGVRRQEPRDHVDATRTQGAI